MRRLAAICIALVGITASAGEPSFELDQPSFVLDVMPILSKAGCNGGGCHGALAGKAGFRLSLFGYDPESDYLAITRDARGRRVDLADPGASLLLTKPTTALPHKGGKRLDVGGDDYKLLAAWIEAGSPGPRENEKKLLGIDLAPAESPAALGQAVALTVTARYDDGSSRDVTRWARFTSADETVASVDPVGRVSVVGHGAGAVTAWFSSQIAVARVIAPFPHAVAAADYAAAPRANFISRNCTSSPRRRATRRRFCGGRFSTRSAGCRARRRCGSISPTARRRRRSGSWTCCSRGRSSSTIGHTGGPTSCSCRGRSCGRRR
jgi:hypothetical protein